MSRPSSLFDLRCSAAAIGLLALASLNGNTAIAQARSQTPIIAGYDNVAPVENAGERPDPATDYKVVMSVTTAADPARPPDFRPEASLTHRRDSSVRF